MALIRPVAWCDLTDGFGAQLHTGQDYGAPTGTPIHAAHTGRNTERDTL